MNSLQLIANKLEQLFAEGKYVEDFEREFFGNKKLNIDPVIEELFGNPIDVISDFERKLEHKANEQLIYDLIKAGEKTLLNYKTLVDNEITYLTPSLSEVVTGQSADGISLDYKKEKRDRSSEKRFAILRALSMIEELKSEMYLYGSRKL